MTRRSRLRTAISSPAPRDPPATARARQVNHLLDALTPSEQDLIKHAHCMLDPRSATPARSSLGFPGESQLIKTTASGSMVVGTDGFAAFRAWPTAANNNASLQVSTATSTGGEDAAAVTNFGTVYSNSPYVNADFVPTTRYCKYVAAAVYVKYSGRADEAAGQHAAKVGDFNGSPSTFTSLRDADGSYCGANSQELILPWFPQSGVVCDPVPEAFWPLQALGAPAAGSAFQYDRQLAYGVFSGTPGSSFDIELVAILEISGPGMAPVTLPPPDDFVPHPSARSVALALSRAHSADHRRGGGTPWYKKVWHAVRAVVNNPVVRAVGEELGGRVVRSLTDISRGQNVPRALGSLAAAAAPLALTL